VAQFGPLALLSECPYGVPNDMGILWGGTCHYCDQLFLRPEVVKTKGRSRKEHLVSVCKALSAIGAPLVLLQLVYLLCTNSRFSDIPVDSVEYFAGQKAFTKAVLADGRLGIAFEIKDDPEFNDLLSAPGFSYALLLAYKVRLGGQAVAAPVCSTWVWICQGTAGRTKVFPLGNEKHACVREANIMVSRTVLLLLVLAARGTFWVLEQPKGSLMEYHPRFQWLLRTLELFKKHITMKDFGKSSEKGTWLWTQHECINDIDNFHQPYTGELLKLTTAFTDKHGKVKYNGNKAQLKDSAAYPDAFGQALVSVFHKNEHDIKQRALTLKRNSDFKEMPHIFKTESGTDVWSDAMLQPIFKYLRK
jgi:hypothetical protein